MTTTAVDNNITRGRYGSAIEADGNKQLPTRIEVMRAGIWPETSNKGALTISLEDLDEFVANFNNGVGIPGGKDFGQLPIDFSHDDYKEAAGWITQLTAENGVLYADVTWSTAGANALTGGMYKCFSPSFWPACLGEYHDSEDASVTARNVLIGGGLTNIPFFKDLNAIMASNAGNGKDSKNVNAHKENTVPTLDEVRIKDVASLDDNDKKVLADNKSSLSDAELEKFGMKEKPVDASVTGVSDEDKAILADIKSGRRKVVDASEYDGLKASVDASAKKLAEIETEKIKASVEEHVKRGAIKSDDRQEWIDQANANPAILNMMAKLPDGKVTDGEHGNGTEANVTAADEVRAEASKLIKAARENNEELDNATAMSRVFASNSDLETRYNNEVKGDA